MSNPWIRISGLIAPLKEEETRQIGYVPPWMAFDHGDNTLRKATKEIKTGDGNQEWSFEEQDLQAVDKQINSWTQTSVFGNLLCFNTLLQSLIDKNTIIILLPDNWSKIEIVKDWVKAVKQLSLWTSCCQQSPIGWGVK